MEGSRFSSPPSPLRDKRLDLTRCHSSPRLLVEQYSTRKENIDSIYSHITISILGGGGVGKKTFIEQCRKMCVKEEITSSGRLMIDVVYPSSVDIDVCEIIGIKKEYHESRESPKARTIKHKYRIHIDDRVQGQSNNAHVYLVFFDLTSFSSIIEAQLKIEEIRQSRRPSIEDIVWHQYQTFPCILVGNKLDYSRHLSDVLDHAKDIMKKENVSDYALISSKTGDGFSELLQKVVKVRKTAEDLIENILPSFIEVSEEKRKNDGCRIN